MSDFGTGKTEEPLTPEKRRQRDFRTVREIDYQTAKEAHDTQFDEMARIIDNKLWKDKPRTTPNIAITPLRHLHISIKQADGTIINNSRYGVTLSFTHNDINPLHEDWGIYAYDYQRPHTEALSFGIGYVTDRSQIVEAAQGAVSDEDLATGVKAYFVQS